MNEEPTTVVTAGDLYKTYTISRSPVRVLQGASLEVAAGETMAILGKSGAGKSTLLHILGGLDRPDRGCVRVRGRDVYGMSSRKRTRMRASEIGFVFQSYHLLPEMDVMENVMLPAMALGGAVRNRRAMRKRALGLLETVGLADRADHTPLELSGGEQQRVALARALVNDPMLVLADEPTGNLDGPTGKQILDYMFSLVAERRHTLVLVTHNEDIAGSCTRRMRLREGVLFEESRP